VDYRRYALGSYALKKWVECTECGNPAKPTYIWQGNDRSYNLAFVVNAVMQHEIAAHTSNPLVRAKK